MRSRLKYMLQSALPPQGDGFDKTRWLILGESSLANTIVGLTTGVFLTGFLKQMGLSDALTAVVIQLPLLMSLVQLVAPVFFESKPTRLPYLRSSVISFRLLLCLSFLITPLLPFGKANVFVFIALYLFGYMIGYFSDPCYLDFVSTALPDSIRARFWALRDMVLVFCSTAATLGFSLLLDNFRRSGRAIAGFNIIGFVALGLTLVLLVVYMSMKQPPLGREPTRLKLKNSLLLPFRNKAYRRFMLINCLYCSSFSFANAFNALYMISLLQLDFAYVSFIGVLNTIVRILCARPMAMLMQRWGNVKVVSLSLVFYGLSVVMMCLSTGASYVILMPISGLLCGVAMSGINLGLLNMNTESAPAENRTSYFSMNACLAPLAGFAAALLSALLCDRLEGATWNLLGISMTNMQTIFLIGSAYVFLIAAAVGPIFHGVRKKRGAAQA